MPADDGKGKLARRPIIVALLAAVAALSAAPAVGDALRDAVERTLAASYAFVAMRMGSPITSGTQQWTESLKASVDGMMKILPADCIAENFALDFCGLGMTNVGSDAMAPTLRAREAVFFEPYSRRNTLQRGDIVVFNVTAADQGSTTRHIFRAVGLPGETVELIDGVVHIDGKPMSLVATGDKFVWDLDSTQLDLFRETTPEGRSYLVARNMSGPPYLETAENAGPFVVPDGHVLVLGDNRHNAADSRYPDQMGGSRFIGLEQLVGKVELIFLSPDAARTGLLVDPQ